MRTDDFTATVEAAAAYEAAHALPDADGPTWDDVPEHERPAPWDAR